MGAGNASGEKNPCEACEASKSVGRAGPTSKPRPPNREEIGRAAWRYVHCLAANFPDTPVTQEQVSSLGWIRAFLRLYPCHLCAQEFIEVCRDLPPRLGSRDEYVMWWCEAHNRVRSDLSQPLRRCELQDLLAAGQAGLTLAEVERCKSAE
mmetsp:Transcript_61333/g.100222  ORF Transcript_61333/g.100222 Transcript_61333/m.100222 type:complete len:151 (-) Transcript_61333:11-463(-)